MVRNPILALLALAWLATAARAGMYLSIEKRVNPGSAAAPYTGFANAAFTTDTGMNAGAPASTWVSYALGVIPIGGEKVTTFDITLNMPVAANSGFSQRWTLDADEPGNPAVATPSNASVTTGDSHLIVSGSIQFVAPTENTGFPGAPPVAANTSTRSYGVGSSMYGAWGFTPAEQALQQNGVPVRFAYIVVPRDFHISPANFIVTANVASSTNAAGYTFNNLGTQLQPPEVLDQNLGDVLLGTTISTVLSKQFAQTMFWGLNSFTGPGGPMSGATVDPLTGQFNWNSTGGALGTYTASITGIGGSGALISDIGTLTFNVVVPEPTGMLLLALALGCVMGIRAR